MNLWNEVWPLTPALHVPGPAPSGGMLNVADWQSPAGGVENSLLAVADSIPRTDACGYIRTTQALARGISVAANDQQLTTNNQQCDSAYHDFSPHPGMDAALELHGLTAVRTLQRWSGLVLCTGRNERGAHILSQA